MAKMRKDKKQDGVYFFDETEEEIQARTAMDALAEMQEFLQKKHSDFKPSNKLKVKKA